MNSDTCIYIMLQGGLPVEDTIVSADRTGKNNTTSLPAYVWYVTAGMSYFSRILPAAGIICITNLN